MIGSKPGAHIELGLQTINSNWDGHQPQVYLNYILTSGTDGQFKFDHVPPGRSTGRQDHPHRQFIQFFIPHTHGG